jgi:hypothetical protein
MSSGNINYVLFLFFLFIIIVLFCCLYWMRSFQKEEFATLDDNEKRRNDDKDRRNRKVQKTKKIKGRNRGEDNPDQEDQYSEDNPDQEEDERERDGFSYEFQGPVSFQNTNHIRFQNETAFHGPVHVKAKQNIQMGRAPLFMNDASLYFGDPDVVLNKRELHKLKIARSKMDYLLKSQDVANLKEGKLTHLFSSRLSGTNACTSKIWDILVGKDVSPADLCESCCLTRAEQHIILVLNMDERLSISMQPNPISVSQVQFKVLVPSTVLQYNTNTNTNTPNLENIIAYRSSDKILCRLIVTSSELKEIQNQNYRPNRDDIVFYPLTMKEMVENTKENVNAKYGHDRRYIEWGDFQSIFALETFNGDLKNVKLNNLLLQVLPDDI